MTTPTINYTARDFDTIKDALKLHLQAKFPTTWRDFYEDSVGMALLELIAYTFDILSYYTDVQANEVFLDTARDRESIIKIAKLVGYQISTPTPAAVDVEGTLAAIEAVDIIVPAGTAFQTGNGINFEFLADRRIPAGQLTAFLTATQGETKSESKVSDGSQYQTFSLSNTPVIRDSVSVTVGGVDWEEMISLAYATDASKAFSVEYDANNAAVIKFGDGTNGMIPPNGETILVSYRIGGGVTGNIPLNEVDISVQGYREGSSPVEYVTVALTNNTYRGSGGEDQETIEHAKLWMPRWVRTNNRAVTEQDFDTLSSLFSDPVYGSVAFAKAKLRQEIPELNTVDVYIWALDNAGIPAEASAGLIAALQAYFDNNEGDDAVRIISVDVVVQNGDNAYINVDVSIKPSEGFAAAAVQSAVNDAIVTYFSGSDIQPGAAFRLSKLYKVIQEVTGVEYAIVNKITASGRSTLLLGTGDASEVHFTGVIPDLPLTPSGIRITAGSLVVTDDGNGNLIGNVGAGVNTVDYETGAIDVNLSSAPAMGVEVTCRYDYILSYQRGEDEATSTGAARYTGSLEYPPVVPGTLAFSDGVQTVTDDGNGNLIGDVYSTGTIDYDTGFYDFTFAIPPIAGTVIRSTYQQKLQSASEDLPIEKYQMAVKNLVTVNVLT